MVKFGLCTLVGAQSHPTLQPHGLYVACQAPLSMGISQQEYWSCHFLLQRIFLTQGSNPSLLYLLHWQAYSLRLCHLRLNVRYRVLGELEKNSFIALQA